MALRGWALGVGLAVGLVSLAVAGCGDDDAGTPDGAVVDDAEVADSAVDASRDARPAPGMPAPPLPPVFTPCPTGWREVVLDGVTTCDPYPATGRATCPDDQAHFPGDPGCSLIGTACPVGDWATDLPVGPRIIYVKRGAVPSGLGTQAAPLTTLSGALAIAVSGDVIALDKQSYSGGYEPAAGVTLWGACVASTVLSSTTTGDIDGVVTQLAGRLTLRNLTIRANRPGLVVRQGAEAVLQGVLIASPRHLGIDVVGGTLDARSLVVRDTVGLGDDLSLRGRALRVRAYEPAVGAIVPGNATVRRAVFERNQSADLAPVDSSVTLEDAALVGTRDEAPSCSALCGSAVVLQHASATLRRVFIADQAATGVVGPTDAILDATDLVIRGVARDGVELNSNTMTTLSRALIQSRNTGVWLNLGNTALSDIMVRDSGGGFSFVTGGELRRAQVVRTTSFPCMRSERIDLLEDVLFQDCADQGLAVATGDLKLVRLTIRGAHDAGMNYNKVSRFSAVDLRIEGTRPMTPGGFASGLTVQGAATGVVRRFWLADNTLVGAQMARAATLDLSEGEIDDHAVGINVQRPAFDLNRLLDQVILRRNGVNLDSATLWLPPPP